jgi:hypothetical protein
VAFGWIFFRSHSFASARAFLERLSSLTSYHPNLDARVVAVLVVGLVTHFVPRGWYEQAKLTFCALPAAGQAVLLFGALLVLRTMAGAEAVPFVYFQF